MGKSDQTTDSFFWRFIGVGSIHGATAVAYLLIHTLLGRELARADYGRVALVYFIGGFLPVITSLGLSTSLLRALAPGGLDAWNWKRFLRNAYAIAGTVILLVCVIVAPIYGLRTDEFMSILAIASSNLLCIFTGAVFKSQGLVVQAIFLERAALFWAFGMILFWWPVSGHDAILALAISCGVQGLIALALVSFKLPSGTASGPDGMYQDALSIELADGSRLIVSNLDQLLIPRVLGHAQLGAYMAVVNVMRLCTLLFQVIMYVLLPRFSRNRDINPRSYWPKILLLALFVTVGYTLFGAPILHVLYDGAFDHEQYLLLPLLLGQLAVLFYAIPLATLQAWAPRARLLQVALANVVLLGVGALLLAFAMSYFGLSGAAFGMVVVVGLLVAIAQWHAARCR